MPAETNLNPFDVEGLEKSLSDSATRVSTIWISYLLFGLYLLVAAGTATPKQLLLADPVKLPALGTDVPLVSFFILSPIFFVLLQFYVLLQTLLLGRTAKAYNSALDATLVDPNENAMFRERLANTIFAQIFAGAPREREGWVGSVLRGIRWFTLVGSPVLVLLTFQLSFLPYHSWEVTWTHRILIYLEVALIVCLWPAVTNPAKDFAWYRLDFRIWRPFFWSWNMSKAREMHKRKMTFKALSAAFHLAWSRSNSRRFFAQTAAVTVIAFSTVALSMPGEWHINFLAGRSFEGLSCERWIPHVLDLDKKIIIDRLVLNDIGIADADAFTKMKSDTPDGADLSKAARSRDLSNRDFVCGQFVGVDLRRAALDKSHFEQSNLLSVRLDGARLLGAFLQDAYLGDLTLKDVDFRGADLRRATLGNAVFNNVDLGRADLRGADLSRATFVKVTFEKGALLSGANLIGLQTKDGFTLKLPEAHLEGASLQYSVLPNLDLTKAIMDGADIYGATLTNGHFDWASAKGLFDKMPKDWDQQDEEQIKLAREVSDTLCSRENGSLSADRSEVVASIIRNALYPNRNNPACLANSNQAICPEQPQKYRDELADRLSTCASKALGPKIDDLRKGIYTEKKRELGRY